jgi:ribosome-associated protein
MGPQPHETSFPAKGGTVLEITPQIRIPETEFTWSFARSGGPGGQNVNKVASKAELRWQVAASPSLPDVVKARLCSQQRRRIAASGELVLHSQRYRDQLRNRGDCLEKLRGLVLQAVAVPKRRKATRPSRGSQESRLREKRRRSTAKKIRRRPAED